MEDENIDVLADVEEFNTLTDLSGNYIRNPKVGNQIEFVCKGFKIVKEKDDLNFTFEKDGKQKTASNALSNVDFGIQIHTNDNAVYWVKSWSVWGQLKGIAKKLNSNGLQNVEVQIDHVANGMLEENRDKAWIVRCKVNGEWKQLNKETQEWE